MTMFVKVYRPIRIALNKDDYIAASHQNATLATQFKEAEKRGNPCMNCLASGINHSHITVICDFLMFSAFIIYQHSVIRCPYYSKLKMICICTQHKF